MMKTWRLFNHILCTSIAAIFLTCFSIPATAKSTIIESENFIMSGDIEPAEGQALVQDLETYRAALFQIVGKPYQRERKKVPILVLQNSAEFIEVTGNDWASGVYSRSLYGNAFVMLSDAEMQVGARVRHIAFHEYAHHFITSYTSLNLPQWYDEGLAEYYSTFTEDENGNFVIGHGIDSHIYALDTPGGLSLVELVNALDEYPMKSTGRNMNSLSDADYFYAQSWAMVHYIETQPGWKAKFKAFNRELGALDDSVALFQKHFGVSLFEFDDELRTYAKLEILPVKTLAPKFSLTGKPVTTSSLSEARRALHIARAMRVFGSAPQNTAKMKNLIDLSGSISGAESELLFFRAELAFEANEYDEAQNILNKARTLAPQNADLEILAGRILIEKNQADGDGLTRQQAREVHNHFKKALQYDTASLMANYLFAVSYMLEHDTPNAQALRSVQFCTDSFKGRNFTNQNMQLIPILISGKKFTDAEALINNLLQASEPGTRSMARHYKTQLDMARIAQ